MEIGHISEATNKISLCVLVSRAHGNYTCNHNAADNLNYHFGDVGGFPRRVFSEVMVGFVVITVK